jgi:hypothetical protein
VGRRSRKRQPAGVAPAAAAPDRPARPPRRSAQERDAAARAKLEPLAPGERPFWVTVAAALAFALAVGTLILVALDYQVTTGGSTRTSGLLQAAVLLVAAFGLWRARYWAVLGFEVLLGVSFAFALLALLRAENLEAVAQCVVGMLITGPLFYFLIRQMARIQMPERR